MDKPHHAQIRFQIQVFPISQDGSIVPEPVSNNELEKLGIKDKAIFNISGYNLENCVKKIKDTLESLKYEE